VSSLPSAGPPYCGQKPLLVAQAIGHIAVLPATGFAVLRFASRAPKIAVGIFNATVVVNQAEFSLPPINKPVARDIVPTSDNTMSTTVPMNTAFTETRVITSP
jgi:hypothetical protein